MSIFIEKWKMTESQLIRTFRSLAPKDRLAVRQLADCPRFNRRAEVSRLAAYLEKNADRPMPKLFEPKKLHAAAFPDEKFDLPKLRHSMSYLLEIVRKSLIFTELETDEAGSQVFLVKALRQRGLHDFFEKEWEKGRTDHENRAVRDADFHFKNYQFHQERLERDSRHARSARLNLQPLPDELTKFYLSEMLRHACSARTHEAVSGQSYNLRLLDALLASPEVAPLLESPAVAVYYHAFRAFQSIDNQEVASKKKGAGPPVPSADFGHLKTILNEQSACFSAPELRSLYLFAINFCIRKMNAGERDFIREAFDFYRAALEKNVLLENGQLSGFTYKNIIRLGHALGELAWTEAFLEKYRTALPAREREQFYRYNLAWLRFQQTDFARAMPLLQQVELEDALNLLDARRMLLRSYVELGEWDALDALLTSFGHFLQRKKGLGYHQTMNLNLVKILRKWLEIRDLGFDKQQKLAAEIAALSPLAEKEWLLKKVGEAVD